MGTDGKLSIVFAHMGFDSDMDNSDMNTISRLAVVASGVAVVHPRGCSSKPQGGSYSIQVCSRSPGWQLQLPVSRL